MSAEVYGTEEVLGAGQMMTKVERLTLLLYELALLPKKSRPEGMVEGSQSVTLPTLLINFLGKTLVRMNGHRRTYKIPTSISLD